MYLFNTATRQYNKVEGLPLGVYGGASFHKDGIHLAFTISSARSSSDVYVYDVRAKKLVRWTESEMGGMVPDQLSQPSLISWKSFDNRSISGFYYKPHAKFTGKRPVIINIHGGHLPDYRGCHCFFFALLEGRFDAIGSTIHYVDRGIDTGDIIQVARPAIDDSDSPESLYCKAERLAARRLVEHLHALRDGRPVLSMPQQFRGRLCLRRHRRPAHDLRFAWRRRTGRLRFPTVREGERWQSGNRE